MIIKTADDRTEDIEKLRTLLNHPNADKVTKSRIEQEIRNIQAGIRGEKEAAYEFNVHYGASKNWMVINDLRVDHDSLVAQIDHLLINRFMEIYVCESKHFSEGISINEHGEFTAFYGSKPYGVPSPIEQNNKHILILKRLVDSGVVKLPTRLGFTLKPAFKSLVLVSKNARIKRPSNIVLDDLTCIVKMDQVFKTIDRALEGDNNPLTMAKIIGQDTLEKLARDIIALHKPSKFNWNGKFGLPDISLKSEIQELEMGCSKDCNVSSNDGSLPNESIASNQKDSKPKQKLICHNCNEPVELKVARFCWFNKPKFNGNIYCIDCQKVVQLNA